MTNWCRHCGEDIELAAGPAWTAVEEYNEGLHCPSSPDGAHHPARDEGVSAV